MKKFALVFLLFASCLISRADVVPVDFSQIRIADGFWLPRIEKLTDVTLPVCLRKCCDETHYQNFLLLPIPTHKVYAINEMAEEKVPIKKTVDRHKKMRLR